MLEPIVAGAVSRNEHRPSLHAPPTEEAIVGRYAASRAADRAGAEPWEAMMKIEHAAYHVEHPAQVADWYVRHLSMSLRRSQSVPPYNHYLADSSGSVLLEIYNPSTRPVPDYRGMSLHVAFAVARPDDIVSARERLIEAGASAESDTIATTEGGDRLTMLRDPWGLAIQLVDRATPIL